MDIREELRQFLLKEVIRNQKVKIADSDSLIKGGLIDSFALMQVQMFMEDAFGVRVPDPDMTVENMDTIEQMARYVEVNRK